MNFFRLAGSRRQAARSSFSDSVAVLVDAGEGAKVEFKSTFRWDLRQNKKSDAITHASLKSIAAFLNTDGGTLLIGITDDGAAVGIQADGFPNDDKFRLHLYGEIKASMGIETCTLVDANIEMYDGRKVCVVRCRPSSQPVYVRGNGKEEEFFIRIGPSSARLGPRELVSYISRRFSALA
jgi:predicted HTH transcriptional regulator